MKPKTGDMMGASDGDRIDDTARCRVYSRMWDLLKALEAVGFDKAAKTQAFAALPDEMKLEFNYGRWTYLE